MARIVKPLEKHHSARMSADAVGGEMLIVGRGRNAYLWAGNMRPGGPQITTYSGRVTLRKFAYAILAAVGEK